MRVLGLMTAWASELWIGKAIQNHLKICNQIAVGVAPFRQNLLSLRDNTLQIAQDIEHMFPQRVKVIDVPQGSSRSSHQSHKARVLNKMLSALAPDVGDVIMICDVDEFYDDTSIARLKDHFTRAGQEWDALEVRARFFFINMYWYQFSKHMRFFLVNSSEFKFFPTQRPMPKRRRVKQLLGKAPMFHYSMLAPIEYKKQQWLSERPPAKRKAEWLEKVYRHWNPNNVNLCNRLAPINKDLLGHHGLWVTLGHPPAAPYLYRYDGQHPREVERLIKTGDFR